MRYAYIGSFNYHGSEGINICRYDENTGKLEYIKTVFPEINAGFVHVAGNLLYSTDEQAGDPGKSGVETLAGGGRVYTFSIDPDTGDLDIRGCVNTLAVNPSHVTLDRHKKYAIVTHFSVGPMITKTIQDADGRYSTDIQQNDTTTCLFQLNQDGSFGKLCDVHVHHAQNGKHSLIHTAYPSPKGDFYAENDLGADILNFLRIDYERARLNYISAWPACEDGAGPRHGVFHPTLPYLYINYENKGAVTQFRVDGPEYIRRIEDVNLFPPGSELTPQDNQSELLISPDGKFLYDFVRGKGLAVVLSIDQQTGKPDVIQRLQLGGPDPRGAAWSPDKRFILVAGHDSMETETLEIGEDGLLVFTGRTCKMPHPAFISFYPSEK